RDTVSSCNGWRHHRLHSAAFMLLFITYGAIVLILIVIYCGKRNEHRRRRRSGENYRDLAADSRLAVN
ncbi:hypothetical protein Ancab_007460, partial [Ancistrocladus abbreviatus]